MQQKNKNNNINWPQPHGQSTMILNLIFGLIISIILLLTYIVEAMFKSDAYAGGKKSYGSPYKNSNGSGKKYGYNNRTVPSKSNLDWIDGISGGDDTFTKRHNNTTTKNHSDAYANGNNNNDAVKKPSKNNKKGAAKKPTQLDPKPTSAPKTAPPKIDPDKLEIIASTIKDPKVRPAFITALEKVYDTPARQPLITYNQIDCSIPYTEEQIYTGALHIGQRKLILNEIQFLTRIPSNEQAVVVYAGSAPSNKGAYLAALFPNIRFILIDPAKFDIRPFGSIRAVYAQTLDDAGNTIPATQIVDRAIERIKSYDICILRTYMTSDIAEELSKRFGTQAQTIRADRGKVGIGKTNDKFAEKSAKKSADKSAKMQGAFDDVFAFLEEETKSEMKDSAIDNVLVYGSSDATPGAEENSDASMRVAEQQNGEQKPNREPNPNVISLPALFNWDNPTTHKLYFVSDIRTNYDPATEGAPSTFDIVWNSAQMMDWILKMGPVESMLKFRVPFYNEPNSELQKFAEVDSYSDTTRQTFDNVEQYVDLRKTLTSKKFRYFKGDINIQPWAPISSTETRLIIKPNSANVNAANAQPFYELIDYPLEEYENRFFCYNKIIRNYQKFENPNTDYKMGFDHCADCALENQIWTDYCHSRNITDPAEIKIEVLKHVGNLSGLTYRPLRMKQHGNFFGAMPIDTLIARFKDYKRGGATNDHIEEATE